MRSQAPRSKYGAQRTTVDGITFASKKEARRYGELRILERVGRIRGLTTQPVFRLCVTAQDLTTTDIIGEYRADFVYDERRGDSWFKMVEDVKGFKTPLYRWKKKHVEAQYGIQIREI